MQPLDVAFMNPISKFYSEEIADWQRKGNAVGIKDVFYFFGKAFKKAAKVETAQSGFRRTGIHPFNLKIFPDSEFVNLAGAVSDANDLGE